MKAAILEILKRPTLFLYLGLFAVVVGIPAGLYGQTLTGGTSLGESIIPTAVTVSFIILLVDRLLVRKINPLHLSITELIIGTAFLLNHLHNSKDPGTTDSPVKESLKSEVLMHYQLDLFADYFQIYLLDESKEDINVVWSDEAVTRLLDTNEGVVSLMTARNMTVPVKIEVFEKEPEILNNADTINQINECDLEITSRRLVVMGSTDYFPDAQRIDLSNGWYRLRIYYNNFGTLSEDKLEGNDSYYIQIWKQDQPKGLKVIMQYPKK